MTYKGDFKRYAIIPTKNLGEKPTKVESLKNWHTNVGCMVYDCLNDLVLVGGVFIEEEERKSLESKKKQVPSLSLFKITDKSLEHVWSIHQNKSNLSNLPFSSLSPSSSPSYWKKYVGMEKGVESDLLIFKISLSPSRKHVSTLDLQGNVFIVDIKQQKLVKFFSFSSLLTCLEITR